MSQAAFDPEAVDALIQQASQLHSAPQVAESILKLTRDPDFEIREVVDCIERDPALVARLLRIVNSSRYGLRYPIGNLRQATAYLGQRTVRLIAMTFSIVEVFTSGPARKLYKDYWQHAMTMAVVGTRLSEGNEQVETNDAYTAGLLADLGTLLFAQVKRNAYVEMYQSAENGRHLLELETEHYGFGHAVLSARLLEQWDFPPVLVAAIETHHEDEPETDTPLARVVRSGNLMAEALWRPNPSSAQKAREALEQHFAVDMDGFGNLARRCKQEVEADAKAYGIHLDRPIDCHALLDAARAAYLSASIETAMDLDSLTSVMDDPMPMYGDSMGD